MRSSLRAAIPSMFHRRLLLMLVVFLVSVGVLAAQQLWKPLADDGLHDPEGPAIGVLQEPADALSLLPGDGVGNKVSWVRALRERYSKISLYRSISYKIQEKLFEISIEILMDFI